VSDSFRLALRSTTAMRLSLAAPGRLQAKVQVHWPGTVIAGAGITITQIGATYTVALDLVGAHLVVGADLQAWDADLDAVASLSGTGIAVRTGSGTWATRFIAAPAAGIGVTNGDGVAGNPTLSLANDLAALESLASSGFAARTGADAWAIRLITGTANQISVVNGDGVAGNPTLSLPARVTILEGLRIGFSGTAGAASRIEWGDADSYLDFNAGNPYWAADPNDFIQFTRATNTYNVNVGGTSTVAWDASAAYENKAIQWTGDISPAQITADQNDYNPTGLSTASTLRLNSNASRTITGLAGGADGRILTIHNVGAQDIVLADESASSSAANRFALTANLTIGADMMVLLQYDSTSSRWRCVSGGGGGGGGAPTDASYVTLATDATLTSERVLTAGGGITLTDAGAGSTITVAVNPAAQSDQETATSIALPVTPGRQQFHPSACKAWVRFQVNGTRDANYNVSSITDNGAGDWTVNFGTAFSTANYGAAVDCAVTQGGTFTDVLIGQDSANAPTASAFRIRSIDIDTGAGTTAYADPPASRVWASFFGDQ